MSTSQGGDSVQTVAIVAVIVVIVIKVCIVIVVCRKRGKITTDSVTPDSRFLTLAIGQFLENMEREKPIKFTSQQLRIATDNFTNLLGSGGFGVVYKGIFSNGTMVAVKVLHGSSDKRIEEQFRAEVSTIGRVHHFNLVRLYGFCFEINLRALVYEYMENGSLDKYLFSKKDILGFEKLHQIAIETAKGIAYLNEACRPRIIHYDIKPGNILLDVNYHPKVADFELAKLCDRDNTHITMTGGRGTPGYAAPELWMPYPITRKCDTYSFGMLLFEIIGRRRNLVTDSPESSQEWFPKWVWKKFEVGSLEEVMIICGIREKEDKVKAARMVKIALWCVQYRPESRPLMNLVVEMLEGEMEIHMPMNPFPHLLMDAPVGPTWTGSSATVSTFTTSWVVAGPSVVSATPIMKRYEIEFASA